MKQRMVYPMVYGLLVGWSAFAGVARAESVSEADLLALSLEELLDVDVGEVSVASGFKQTATQAPAVTSVITAQDIQSSGASDLSEVLRQVPGLYAYPNQAFEQSYQMRGIESYSENETLLLINGQPYKNLLDGNRGAWAGFPLENIARIEVIRGPGSALYGADAFAGVINLITKTATDIAGTETGARVGSERERHAWLLHGGEVRGVEVAANVHYYSAKNEYDAIQFGPPEGGDPAGDQTGEGPPARESVVNRAQAEVERFNASVDLAKNHWRLRLDYLGINRWDNGSTRGQDDSRDEENRTALEWVYHNPEFRPHWDARSSLRYVHWNSLQRSMFDDISVYANHFERVGLDLENVASLSAPRQVDLTETQWRFDHRFLYSGIANHKLSFGFGYAEERLPDTEIQFRVTHLSGETETIAIGDQVSASLPDPDRETWHAYLQDAWRFAEGWELTAGLRYDHYPDFGATFNPRLALVWQTSEQFSSKFLYGKAFMAPAYMLLNVQEESFIQANPDLEPQTIDTYELAFDYHPGKKLGLALNLYYFEVKDQFSLEPNGDGTGLSLRNSARQSGYGGELEFNWRFSDNSKFSGYYAYNHTDDFEPGSVGYPRHQAYLDYSRVLNPAWYLNARANWVLHQADSFGSGQGQEEVSFTPVDLSLRYQKAGQPWEVAFGARNLLNESAEKTMTNLSLRERNYFAELRYYFR